MYSFVRGSRLFVKGSRERDDADNVPDPGDQLEPEDSLVQAVYQTRAQMASASQESREVYRTAHNRSGLRTVQTSRIIRKTTTLTRGEHKTVSSPETHTTDHAGTQTKALPRRSSATSTDSEFAEKAKRIYKKTSETKPRKKPKISDIIGQTDESLTAKEALLRWAQRTTDGYPGVKVKDFTRSWRDGLAFNAIIHRNRPDKFDWRSLRSKTAHEKLDHAFTVAERDFSVTRLLDPEDVDTKDPDEKSLITYISSMYDVFPNPPSYHPFADTDKLRKIDDYKEFASHLHLWIRENISILRDRNFPNTLVEMKSLLSECTRFRNEDVPPKQHEKQKLSHMYRELQKIFRDSGHLDIEPELQSDSLERDWDRLLSTIEERDLAIRDEISRLEKLQRLAEKVHRQTKQCEGRLDEMETKLSEEEKRIQRLEPSEAKHICEELEQELKSIESSIKTLFQDVQTLRDGRYHQAPELHRRVQNLHQRWSNIHVQFTTRIMVTLKKMKKAKPLTEKQLVETNEAFKFLQDCIEWVSSKLKFIEEANFGNDLASVKSLLEQHQTEHRTIDQFQKNVDQCGMRKNQFRGEEYNIYCKMLSRLDRGYSELLVLSNKRLSDLDALLDFIQTATNQLIWMNEKEEIEVSRNWGAKSLNIVEIEQHQENFTNEMELREPQIENIKEQGYNLQRQNHPAVDCIEAYIAALQTQWMWLKNLNRCLNTHLRHASSYHQFFTEARECEKWLNRVEERLNSTFSRQHFSIDEGDRLLRDMLELMNDLNHYGHIVHSLGDRSKEIMPLKQRRQQLSRPLRVTSICSYKQMNMVINREEQCWLHDNSQKIKWKVINSAGTEGMVPSVCFVIPPPNPEAIDLAESLKKKYDLIVKLWSKKHHKLRQHMVFATIRIIKSWDFATFRSMEPTRRDSILRALNEDGQKLVDEGDPNDPDLKRLQEEIKYCNKLFEDFLRRLKDEEADKSSSRKFNDLSASLQNDLNEKDKILKGRVQESIPRDLESLETLVFQHKEFESDLITLEPQVAEVKELYSSISKKTPGMQPRLDNIVETWDRIWSISNFYSERLKAVEIALNEIDETNHIVSQLELQLADYDTMPSDEETLQRIHNHLGDLQGEVKRGQPVLDQLNEDAVEVRRTTEQSRPKQIKHPDVKKMEDDIVKLTKRWDRACSQVVDRLKSCENAASMLKNYKKKIEKEEQPWIEEMTQKVNNLKSVKYTPPKQAEVKIQPALDLYNALAQRKPEIENANTLGGKYIREAKMAVEEKYRLCDDSLSKLLTWIADVEMQLAELGLVRENVDELQQQLDSAKVIKDHLDDQQRPVTTCLDQVRQVVQQGADVLSKDEIHQIQKDSDNLKKRYDRTNTECERIVRKLTSAQDELMKFSSEHQTFRDWLHRAQQTLVEKEKDMGDLHRLKDSSDSYRVFANDVLAHQADLRFITMAAQKFMDESKEYTKVLNDFRTNLPHRLSYLEPRDSMVKTDVAKVTSAYQDLLSQVTRLSDQLFGLGEKQRHYADCVEKATMWLTDVQKTAKKLIEEPVAAEPRIVQDQLDRVKALSLDVVSQSRLITSVKQAGKSLLDSLEETDVSQAEKESVKNRVKKLEDDYNKLNSSLNEKSNELQTVLVHSQDIQDGIDRLLKWLDEAEGKQRSQSKSVSLVRERLEEQVQEHRIFQSDINSQRPTIDAVNNSAKDLLNSSNPRLTKKVESKLRDVNTRFEKLCDRAHKRKELLDEISALLSSFEKQASHVEESFDHMLESVEGYDNQQLSAHEYATHIEDVLNQRNSKKDDFEQVVATGKSLVSKRDVTDTTTVKEKIRSLELLWKELYDALLERQKAGKVRAEQLSAYETLRQKVFSWLTTMETKVENLGPVAVEKEMLRKQAMEIKPLVKEHSDYAITIDKVNDLGNSYDAILRGEPARRLSGSPIKRSSIGSPTSTFRKASSKLRRTSEGHSPSPSRQLLYQSPNIDRSREMEDASPIQQELSEINNRYNLLGVKLSDRHHELEDVADELKGHMDTLKVLSNFVQSKERQLSKETLPSSKDQAEKQLNVVKAIQEEVQEKQSEVDRLKTQTSDLLRRKPNLQGSEAFEAQVTEVVSGWSDLSSNIKQRLGFLQDLKDFQDTHDLLSNWLSQKDKMFQALGPIAAEPRMVTAQMQQVQVMRDECTCQQPVVERFGRSGNAIMENMGRSSPSAKKVRDQMDNVQRHWDDLVGRLEDREKNLDAASGVTRDFQENLNHLQESLQHISDEYDHLSSDGSDADGQLKKLEDLEKQLEDQRPLLADAESVCEQLCDLLSDSGSKNEIKNKLNAVEKQYNNLNKKIENRKAELESAMKEDQEFYLSCDCIQHWLNDMEQTLGQGFPISADHDTLTRQITEFEPIYKEVLDKEHEVHILLGRGSDMVNKTSNRNDASQLKNRLNGIKQQWEKIRKDAVDRNTRLQRCVDTSLKFHSSIKVFLPWLDQSELKLLSLPPVSFHRAQLDKQIKEIQAFKNDLSQHSQEFDNIKNLGQTLISKTDTDQIDIQDELDQLKRRWETLNKGVLERVQSVDDISQHLADYRDNARDLQHALQRLEDRLVSHDALGSAGKDAKLLERLKGLLGEARDLEKQLDQVKDSADLLITNASPSSDTSHITQEVDNLDKRHHQLTQKLREQCADLELASSVTSDFNAKLNGVHYDLNALEEELDNMAPIARDIETVQTQLDDIKDFMRRLDRVEEDVKDTSQQAQDLISQRYTSDPGSYGDHMDNMRRQLGRLEERSKTRNVNLESTLSRLEKFYGDYKETMKDLEDAVQEEKNFKIVSGDVDLIRAQQEQFQEFHKNRVAPLGAQVKDINKLGQGLVQSASSGVNTADLEQDLETLNNQWNNLKERLNEKERLLDLTLLQSGKFHEALEGVQKWLEDTEEMVSNQKPPSADYKVVKAQLQEQNFLRKLLLDRQNSMSSLSEMGAEVMRNLEDSERAQIEDQLEDLSQRFNELTAGARERTDILEQTLPVARAFQEKMTPLVEWLDQTERKLSGMATIPTDQERIRRRIEEHRDLHEDILDHKESFEDLTETVQTLMGLVGDDEAQTVVEKFQDVTDRYAKLVEDSENIGQLLAEAYEGLGNFVVTFEDLLAWMDEMESRLGRCRVLSVYVDKLQEQMYEIVELNEEIADHHTQIDSLISSAHEIMKHASGDEALQVKEKVDPLHSKFTELAQRCSERHRQALEALPITQNFHSSHETLATWMDEAERVLKTLDVSSLESQESKIQRLEAEIQEYRSHLESVNHLGPRLCQISPGEGAYAIESIVTKDNRRFDAVCEQVQRKAERIELSKQKNVEVVGDIDELLDWFREAEQQLQEAEPIYPDPDSLTAMVKEQKAFNEEVSSQKGRVRDILAAAKKLIRESSSEDQALTREKADDLKELANTVSTLCMERLNALEQALPLAEHFFESHVDLVQWLDEMEAEAELLDATALNASQIRRQQNRNNVLLQSVNEHKPLVDKLNKTGHALLRLCEKNDGVRVKECMDSDNSRYTALRNSLKDKQNELEEALQATSQFSDKLDGMLNALSSTADQLNNAEPISAHPDRIQDQINDNDGVLHDLSKRSPALEAVKQAANDVISKAGGDEPAVKDIRQKLDKLNDLWDTIQKSARKRGRSLEDAMALAERFWDELTAVMKALKELQEYLTTQEPPAVEPSAIQQQQEVLQEIKQEMEQTKPEVDQCRQVGQDLMQLCGEPDKPEVKKHIEDLDSAWDNVTTLYAKREQNLVDAMEKAMNFHDTLKNFLEFLDTAEDKFANLGPIGSDIESVKGQMHQLKDFKNGVDPHMVEIEALNRQAQELIERTSPSQVSMIREPMDEINHRWDELLKGIVDRQQELEHALLRLGQFQHALDELLVWISRTENTLDDLHPVFGDSQVIEVELAKHKVLMNDIQAHQTSVDTLNRAGRQLIDADRGSEDANITQKKLNDLNSRWQQLQDKAADRQRELEEALKEAQAFYQEIQDLLMWLSDTDSQLATSKPVGGLPETAREQLNRFMELYNDLDNSRYKIETVLQQGQNYLERSNDGSATNLQHNLRTLKQRWDNVLNRANDRKIKLEIALREATEFHEALQEFVEWLGNSEKYLSSVDPVSRVMNIITEQMEEHKTFQKDISSHREVMLNLDKKGTHLKYFSQKQDVILIKNLLISVQHRWERLVAKSAERTRTLDHGYKEAKEFHDAWKGLLHWLEDADKTLDSLTHIGKDPEKIKQLLSKHKEFQRALGAKQPTYDSTMKLGRTLKDKCPKSDVETLQDMLEELKNKWNSVCNKSVDRQRMLEEALLFSGQFKDAIQALIEWLDKAKDTLATDQPVHGDLDTVTSLVDQHKSFQDELKNRSNNRDSVCKTANELLQTASPDDADHIRSQMSELDAKWEEIVELTNKKQHRLDDALRQAEELHKAVHMLLEWLSDAEMKLRFAGPLPDDEETTRQQLEEHRRFMSEMIEQEVNKDDTIRLAQEILQKCHPDGISVIRHWITIIQSRWEEVSLWAKQREQKLQDHLRSLKDIIDLLEELMAWLIGAESSLTAAEAEPLPDEIPPLEQLIKEHEVFIDEMTQRQPDIDRVTKAFKTKHQPTQPAQKEKGGKHDDRRSSRNSSAGPTHKISTLSKSHSVGDPEIKNPRARELSEKWKDVWLLAMERQRRLQDKLNYLTELERIKNFDFDEWRKRFLGWMNNKKSRVMDLFRKIDKDNDAKVTQEEFIEGILDSKFPTSRLEMERVAQIFDRNSDGFIDHKEYLDTLRPDRDNQPPTDAERIQDEVMRLVSKCMCPHKFKVYQVGEGKYRFGDSQKLRLVRILRSTVMVRVGGGWVALDEFLVKNDPCRAKGRTNLELREQFILAQGVSQSLSPFKPKTSPNASQSSQSGSSVGRSAPLSATGPITKIREKSERSVPIRQRRASGTTGSTTDLNSSSCHDGDQSGRSGRIRTPTTPNRLTPGPKSSSRPPSRSSSRPPSRAGSDLSAESVEAYRGRKRSSSTTRVRNPTVSSTPTGTKGTPTTKIPTVRRSSSTASPRRQPDTVKGRERWK